MVIVSQCIQRLDHHFVHPKHIQFYCQLYFDKARKKMESLLKSQKYNKFCNHSASIYEVYIYNLSIMGNVSENMEPVFQ